MLALKHTGLEITTSLELVQVNGATTSQRLAPDFAINLFFYPHQNAGCPTKASVDCFLGNKPGEAAPLKSGKKNKELKTRKSNARIQLA